MTYLAQCVCDHDGVLARWQPKCRMDVFQKRLSSATRVASTRVKFIAAQSSLTMSNHFFPGLPLVRDP